MKLINIGALVALKSRQRGQPSSARQRLVERAKRACWWTAAGARRADVDSGMCALCLQTETI